MTTLSLVWRELFIRKLSALLAVSALGATVAAALFFFLLARSNEGETRILQRDMGLNLLILPQGTSLDAYWAKGLSTGSMPVEFLTKLEDQVVANRLVPMIKRRRTWQGREVLLTGISGEIFKQGKAMKPVFGRVIESGTLVLGSEIAGMLNLEAGQSTELLGQVFSIAHVLQPVGDEQDVQVFLDLADAQTLLDLEGRITEIEALECHCSEDVSDPLAALRAELEPLLPGAVIIRRDALADARRDQRQLAERFLQSGFPVIALFCALLVGVLSMLNVRDRRAEIGVLRALGKSSVQVAGLFLGRAVFLGLIGGALGIIGGGFLASDLGTMLFHTRAGAVALDLDLVLTAMFVTPLFAALASLVPMALAVTQDPVRILGDAS